MVHVRSGILVFSLKTQNQKRKLLQLSRFFSFPNQNRADLSFLSPVLRHENRETLNEDSPLWILSIPSGILLKVEDRFW